MLLNRRGLGRFSLRGIQNLASHVSELWGSVGYLYRELVGSVVTFLDMVISFEAVFDLAAG